MTTLPVEIDAHLDCDVDGKSFSVRSSGRRTVVEVPDMATVLRIVQLGSSRGNLRESIKRWKRLLDSTLHQVELQVRGRTVGALGYGVGSRMWRLFGLPQLALKAVAIVSVLLSVSQVTDSSGPDSDSKTQGRA